MSHKIIRHVKSLPISLDPQTFVHIGRKGGREEEEEGEEEGREVEVREGGRWKEEEVGGRRGSWR